RAASAPQRQCHFLETDSRRPRSQTRRRYRSPTLHRSPRTKRPRQYAASAAALHTAPPAGREAAARWAGREGRRVAAAWSGRQDWRSGYGARRPRARQCPPGRVAARGRKISAWTASLVKAEQCVTGQHAVACAETLRRLLAPIALILVVIGNPAAI